MNLKIVEINLTSITYLGYNRLCRHKTSETWRYIQYQLKNHGRAVWCSCSFMYACKIIGRSKPNMKYAKTTFLSKIWALTSFFSYSLLHNIIHFILTRTNESLDDINYHTITFYMLVAFLCWIICIQMNNNYRDTVFETRKCVKFSIILLWFCRTGS